MTGRGITQRSAGVRLAAALALVAAAAAVIALPAAEHRPVQAGLIDALLRFDRSVPLAGIGLALAQAPRREIAASAALILVGVGFGSIVGAQLAAMIEADFTLISYLFMLGPQQCIVVGGALLAPATLRALALPLAASVCGLVLEIGALADLRGALGAEYFAGAALAVLALTLVPILLLRDLRWSGLPIATRIAGSWLTAIGLMLLALELHRMQGQGLQ